MAPHLSGAQAYVETGRTETIPATQNTQEVTNAAYSQAGKTKLSKSAGQHAACSQ